MPDISRRAQQLGTENAFVVLAEVNALARQGKDIISFCIGQPDFPAPEHVQEAAIRAIRAGKHGYTPSAGIDELRAAAARYLAGMRGGLPIRPEDVVVGAGAKPFIAYAILSTTDYGAGDEVIYLNPGFPIYESQILANGARPVPIHLHEARDFAFVTEFCPDSLARACDLADPRQDGDFLVGSCPAQAQAAAAAHCAGRDFTALRSSPYAGFCSRFAAGSLQQRNATGAPASDDPAQQGEQPKEEEKKRSWRDRLKSARDLIGG